MSEPDPVVLRLRERISAADHAVLEAVNDRLELVAELHRHKREHALDLHDPDRERWMLADLREANRGPLSEEGVGELLDFLLDLTRRA